MYRINMCFTGLLIIALADQGSGGSALAGPASEGADRFRKLPKGWTVVASVVVPEQQLLAFSQKLGGAILRASNTTLAVDGQRLKVNTIECKTDEDAAKVHEALLRSHQGIQASCPREGKLLFELVAQEMRLIERAYQ